MCPSRHLVCRAWCEDMIPLFLLLVLLTAGHKTAAWDNDYTEVLLRQCPIGESFSSVTSHYSGHTKRDRRWDFGCKRTFPVGTCPTCKWLAVTNSNEIKCDDNGVMAGVYSQQDPTTKDRKWRFYCCSVPKRCTYDCYNTPYTGWWYENYQWYIPGSNYLTAVKRTNFNGYDRRWGFRYCRLRAC